MKLHLWDGYNSETKIRKIMEKTNDEDIITIHLGKVLTEEQYDAVIKSVINFLNTNWSHLLKIQS